MDNRKDAEKSAGKEKDKKKQMSKKKKIILSVIGAFFAVLLIVIAMVAVKNWGNIRAVVKWLTSSKEEIEQEIQKGKEQQITALKDAGMQGASQEMMDALGSGEITAEQFQSILLGDLTLEQAIAENNPSEPVVNTEQKFIDAVDAYEKGQITDNQLLQISKAEITLEQAVEENTSLPDEPEAEQKNDQPSETVEKSEAEEPEIKEPAQNTVDSADKADKAENKKDDADAKPKPEPPKSNSTGFTQEAIDAYKNGEISDDQFAQIGSNNITLDQAKEENKNTAGKNPVQTTPAGTGTAVNQQTPPANTKPVQTPVQTPSSGQQNNNAPGTGNQTPSQPSASTGGNVDEQVAALVTKMYVLKAQYEGSVAGVVESMKAEYSALPASQRTTSAKSSIAASHMGQINSMEAQCDAQVNAIVAELRQILSSAGRDTSLADSILSTYASEKESTKAYYMSRYGD